MPTTLHGAARSADEAPIEDSHFRNSPLSSPVFKSTDGMVWIFNDDANGARQKLFNGLKPCGSSQSLLTMNWNRNLHSRSQLDSLLNTLSVQRPELIWWKLAGPCIGSGNRKDRRRAEHLQRIVAQQLREGRHVILEGNVRNEAWNLKPISELVDSLSVSRHQWCNYGVVFSGNPSSTVTQLAASFTIGSCGECRCGSSKRHAANKTSEDDGIAVVLSRIVLDTQPEFNLEKFEDSRTSIATPSTSKITALTSYPTSARPPANAAGARVERDVSPEPRAPSSSSAILAKQLRSGRFRTRASQTKDDDSKQHISDSNSNSHSNSTPHVTFGTSDVHEVLAYPTEQAIRQKEARNAGHKVVKRKQQVEAHYDDCGEDH